MSLGRREGGTETVNQTFAQRLRPPIPLFAPALFVCRRHCFGSDRRGQARCAFKAQLPSSFLVAGFVERL